MSSEHKRPLYAFLVLTIVCGAFMGFSLKAEALRGILTEGASSLASQMIHVAPVIRLVEPDRSVSKDARRDSAAALVRTPAVSPNRSSAPEASKVVEPSSSLKPKKTQSRPVEPPSAPATAQVIETHSEDAQIKPGKRASGHKRAKHGDSAAKPGKNKKAKNKKAKNKKAKGSKRAKHGDSAAKPGKNKKAKNKKAKRSKRAKHGDGRAKHGKKASHGDKGAKPGKRAQSQKPGKKSDKKRSGQRR